MTEHKEKCLIINRKQNVNLEKRSISFKNHSKQLQVPFEMYAYFECILHPTSSLKENNDKKTSYTEKYQSHIPCSLAYKVICVDNKFSKDIVIHRGKVAIYKFIEKILQKDGYCDEIMKKYFNKNLVMSVNEEEIFQLSNKCWICDKLFDDGDEKIRDHCHITGKFRVAAHFSCNANFKLSRKVPVIFHNLRGYDSHLINK